MCTHSVMASELGSVEQVDKVAELMIALENWHGERSLDSWATLYVQMQCGSTWSPAF